MSAGETEEQRAGSTELSSLCTSTPSHLLPQLPYLSRKDHHYIPNRVLRYLEISLFKALKLLTLSPLVPERNPY